MGEIERPDVWVIFTGRHVTDVVAERQDGDTLPNEEAVEYVPRSQLRGAVSRIEAKDRKIAELERTIRDLANKANRAYALGVHDARQAAGGR